VTESLAMLGVVDVVMVVEVDAYIKVGKSLGPKWLTKGVVGHCAKGVDIAP
jgi:hypothetical protein